ASRSAVTNGDFLVVTLFNCDSEVADNCESRVPAAARIFPQFPRRLFFPISGNRWPGPPTIPVNASIFGIVACRGCLDLKRCLRGGGPRLGGEVFRQGVLTLGSLPAKHQDRHHVAIKFVRANARQP